MARSRFPNEISCSTCRILIILTRTTETDMSKPAQNALWLSVWLSALLGCAHQAQNQAPPIEPALYTEASPQVAPEPVAGANIAYAPQAAPAAPPTVAGQVLQPGQT